ncbi:uncharacterized protein LOC117169595 isoform X2 [Belonocnema kinseyi]|uniref:uncharacterized protein LOC117169595 isoform X2 n=1 Tax=Belonocnema kinseyi TaxID=2817044 RepID=UPI00143D30E2|nr:uncharacterized protein LOC117169595 isoform X2 [Belonocnema kinseyi]
MSINHDDKLPEVVAGLEMLTVANGVPSTPTISRRVLRKRASKNYVSNPQGLNRSQRPKKRTFSEMESEEDVKVYYLDKSVKRSPNTLETIFEEDEKTSDDSHSQQPQMSAKRFKRTINFQTKPSDTKQKKRRLKIKKAFGSKFFRPRRMDIKDVLKKLELIRSSSPVEVEREERVA